jgi:hypothetical protein
MSNAIEDVKNAGQAVKDGFEHLGDTLEKELGGTPEADPSKASPQDCGPVHCDIPETAQA